MKFDEFRKHVEERTEIDDNDEAERTAVTVVQALCDRLNPDECDDLLAQLPEPFKSSVIVPPEVVPMTARDFVEWVASELQISTEEAEQRIRAVFDVLQEAVTPGEFHDVIVQLPSGFAQLVPALSKG